MRWKMSSHYIKLSITKFSFLIHVPYLWICFPLYANKTQVIRILLPGPRIFCLSIYGEKKFAKSEKNLPFCMFTLFNCCLPGPALRFFLQTCNRDKVWIKRKCSWSPYRPSQSWGHHCGAAWGTGPASAWQCSGPDRDSAQLRDSWNYWTAANPEQISLLVFNIVRHQFHQSKTSL
jgi:hypothetical protein